MSAQFTYSKHLISLSALAAGDYYYEVNMERFTAMLLHWRLSTNNVADTVTLNLFESNDPAALPTATAKWVNKTTELLTSAPSATGVAGSAEETKNIADRAPGRYLIHINVTGAATTGAADVFIKLS